MPETGDSSNEMEEQQSHQEEEEPQEPTQEDDVEEEEEELKNEDDELIDKAQKLMDKITSLESPSPTVLHALASILEAQESIYLEENGHSHNNGRSSHTIGRLCSLLRENDEFFELISCKFLSENEYSTAIQAASARLVLACSLTWTFPHVMDDPVMENIKNWVIDATTRLSVEELNPKCDLEKREASDSEMLKTYSTGLLALCLAGGGQIVEDVLTSGLPAKLMRCLRIRVLGETSKVQKDVNYLTDIKTVSGAISLRGREEGRGRMRQPAEATHVDGTRRMDDQSIEIGLQASGEEYWVKDAGPHAEFTETANLCEVDSDGEETQYDESGRDDSSRRRMNKSRSTGKGSTETDQTLVSPRSGNRRIARDRCLLKSTGIKKQAEESRSLAPTHVFLDREENDDCYKDCRIGSKDITALVKKAVSAAEAEARAANAPEDAVKAAGDSAAEVVKSAAFEEFKSTNDEDAAVIAASNAASTVVDAGNTIELLRNSKCEVSDPTNVIPTETVTETNEDPEDYSIPDIEFLAKLREKYSVQCLESLGEYVEVLAPVLLEKGVDVCLALLQRCSKHEEASKVTTLLPDVMKLICALAAHRKFAALFVDRNGMQKLLAVPRVNQTFFGLSSCLFTIGSIQGIMERVCALDPIVIHQLVELGLQLLECSQDQARKNAALFFAAAFVFKAVLDACDAQGGLQKLLLLLSDAAAVRSGLNSGSVNLPNSTSLRNDRPTATALTSSEKQIAYHTCVALRQYFRAHLIVIVDSICPNKSSRGGVRTATNLKAVNKPLDCSNEAIDALFLQLQKDRKLGPAFLRTQWPAVDNFLCSHGHITMLELCQAPPVERYLHDLLQYALGVLHVVTLVHASRKAIVNTTLNNNRTGIEVILDAANPSSSVVDNEIVQAALNVLINLVCPPPSLSNKPSQLAHGQQFASGQVANGSAAETRNTERNISDRAVYWSNQTDNTLGTGAASQTPASGLVGDGRISLRAGTGSAGLAAQLEQVYRQAREAVRASNGIKGLLNFLQPKICFPPATLDCFRALSCRILLGLARDDSIAQILTSSQVGEKLSELIRDPGSQTTGNEQSRWQAELLQVALELIGIVTNSGRASTLAARDAATPTLRRIEREAIADATPISYDPRELLLLIHEHLCRSGLMGSADKLLREAQLTPLPFLAGQSSIAHQPSTQEAPVIQLQWQSGRVPGGFLSNKTKVTARKEDFNLKSDSAITVKKKPLVFSPTFGSQLRNQSENNDAQSSSVRKIFSGIKQSSTMSEVISDSMIKSNHDTDSQCKTPVILPMKRKLSELKDTNVILSSKRLNTSDQGLRSPICATLNPVCKSSTDAAGFLTPTFTPKDQRIRTTPSTACVYDSPLNNSHMNLVTPSPQVKNISDPQPSNSERSTLDSIMIQFLKNQHRQCQAPITTLPPLSLLHQHVCPEPKGSLEAPLNITARLGTREFKMRHGGVHGNRRDRQFVYSRFRPWRTCRDEMGGLLTCMTFLEDSYHVAVGCHSGEVKIFDSNSNSMLDSCTSHQSPVTLVQSYYSGDNKLLLSSSSQDVRLWDAASVSGGPVHSFEGCKAARFSHSGNIFAALSTEPARREILLYDVKTFQIETKLSDVSGSSTGRGNAYSLVHFSPSDAMVLWNGVLWDRRGPNPVHRFDQLSDYGGGGFHPAGNEVIINSEVWDLRKFRLLRSVPSLDQTVVTFNGSGDVIYAILRRNLEDVMSATHTRRVKHPLFSAFRTLDGINYSDIATTSVDRCVLDFTTEPTDSFVGLVTMDDPEEMFSSARVYEIGRRRPTDDDSDPDDAESEEDDEDDDEDDDEMDVDVDSLLGEDIDGDGESDDGDDSSNEDEDDMASLYDEEHELDGGAGGMFEIISDDEDQDNSQGGESFSSGDDEDFVGY